MSASFKSFADKLVKIVESFNKPSEAQQLGDFAANLVKKRTRLGSGVASRGAPKEKLQPLSKSYKDQRAGKAVFFTDANGVVRKQKPKKNEKLSANTTAGKSNLTRTGEMLDSMGAEVKGPGQILVGPQGERNRKVAGFVSEKRPFNNLSDNEIKQVANYLRDKIGKALK